MEEIRQNGKIILHSDDGTSPFSKAFKKWSGYGPLAFRKQKRIEESEDWVRLLEKYK